MSEVRTRFAPSPTGFLHVGGIRTALFAWLLARQANGKFILRIEDTDQSRQVEGAEDHIIDSLKTLGLNYDEGPDTEGAFGPYRQSERLDIYKKWANILIDSGRAYADPYTQEEVNSFRETAKATKKPFLFRNHRPDKPPVWDGKTPLRFKSDPKAYKWDDTVMGHLSAGAEAIDDFILIKSDGYPTYNFAHIIDDHEMQISHVIRGQEFLASIPNYLNLYEALDFNRPILATMPHILNEQGNKKLSKRDGAKDVLDYLRDGFLEEAMINFIASLGWNDGTEQEIFSRQELITKFSLSKVQRSGARFDEQRLLWMNGYWIRNLNFDELYSKIQPYWPSEASSYDEAYKQQVLHLIQERLKKFSEIPQLTDFFFKDLPVNSKLIKDNKQLSKLSDAELRKLLEQTKTTLEACDFTVNSLTDALNNLLVKTNQKPGILFSLIRIATTQAPFSPSLAETLATLGKEVSLRRLIEQLDNI